MKANWVTCVLLFLAGSALVAQKVISEKPKPRYVPVTSSVEPGKAPGMRVQLITREGEQPRQYAVIFTNGDEVASGLLQFAKTYNVTSAHFTAIGALTDATVGWFDRERKMYKAIPIQEQVEVLSMVGDIAMYRDQPVAHTHLVVGHDDGRTEGGHLLEAHVFPTLEVMVTVDPVAMRKTLDPGTGLALITPDAK